MSADIGERLLRWKSGPVLRDYPGYFLVPARDIDEAAAEIVRLRGEVDFAASVACRFAVEAAIRDEESIAPAEAKGDGWRRGVCAEAGHDWRGDGICDCCGAGAPQPADGGAATIHQAFWLNEKVWEDITPEQFALLEQTEAITRIVYAHPPASQVQQITPTREHIETFRRAEIKCVADLDDHFSPEFRGLEAVFAMLSTHPAGDALGAVPSIPWNDDVRNILGRPNFSFCGTARLMRKAGHSIPGRAEEEQAYCLHWLMNLYLRHGAGWMDAANAELEAMGNAALQHRGDSRGGEG